MKRVVLSIGVATLLVCGTLVAIAKQNEPVSAHEMNERRSYALAEKEYAEEVELLGGLDVVKEIASEEEASEKTCQSDVACNEDASKILHYQKDRDHKKRKSDIKIAEQKEFNAWKKNDTKKRKKQIAGERKALREYHDEMLTMRIKEKQNQRLQNIKRKLENRKELISLWEQIEREVKNKEISHGRYADLYKVPAWPTAALFFENMGWINATLSYTYATDAYNSSGKNKDVSILEFGEQQIKVKDLLLASKLVSEKKLQQQEFNDAVPTVVGVNDIAASKYLSYLADQEVKFRGQSEEVKINFDLVRYVFCNDFAIGVELPILYRKNRLKAHLDITSEDVLSAKPNSTGLFGLVKDQGAGNPLIPNAFMRRYGQNTDLFLQDIWKAKGIDSLGGSAMGLGDVAFFMNGKIKSLYFDQMIVGAKVLVPFAKKSSPHRLFGPALGNDGHTEFSVFSSVLFSHQQFINPHIFVKAQFNAPSHNQKRVPKRIKSTVVANNNPKNNLFSLFDRVQGLAAGSTIDDFDTTFKNIGDNITTLKISQGAEFQFRAGNMIERFLSRRGFLDMYYFFRFKASDDVRGIDIQEWNPSVFAHNTKELEHTAGLDYSYQFDHDTRLVAGMLYTFAGKNVPKTFNARISLGFAFK